MCAVCTRIKRLPLGDALILVGEMLEDARADRKHLEEVLDDLLTEDSSEDGEDPELAAEWERQRHEH